MDRSRSIEALATALQDAGARADWDALGRAVRELGPRLQALSAGRAWSAPERAAVARLRGAHEGAQAAAAAASAQLQARLDDMRVNKEGWMAYALAGEPDSGHNAQ
ncbi:hypothetical protein [Massilia yuzhufengensis]|uniref:Protein FliT n=1 Tax=Massilia yuzhufengensis TaxID=1164594 RepID=A0A1I1G9S4_9BURK|nr:hypothetical protein [Massilia yuzhufengensis]SFC05910.1 hypothetical protein SAMN05216204_103178 [Massilia yuzhufengensis]